MLNTSPLAGHFAFTCLAIVAAAVSPRSVLAQSAAGSGDRRAAQVDALFAPWAGPATPGCTVAVHENGQPTYLRAFGMADLEHRVPLAPDSIFEIASVSKQFTAFAVVLLARDGKVSLDDDIRRHIPELPAYGRTITLTHLIHHTNGLRENGYLLGLAGWRPDDVSTEADKLAILVRQRQTNFAAGEEVLYGNSAYDLLREVVRRASGMSLKAFAEQRIFAPLGMRDTHFGDDHLELVPRRAQGYGQGEAGRWLVKPVTTDSYGPGGLLTTVPDLIKWQTNLIDGRVGGMDAVTWVRTSGRLNDGTATTYGGGLRLAGYRGLRTVGHDGLTGGYRTDTVLFPDHGLGIVVFCNASAIAAEELSLEVADLYLGDRMAVPAWPPAIDGAGAPQTATTGTWWSPLTDEIVRLEWRDGALRQLGSPTALVPIGNDTFRPGESRARWQFVAADSHGGRELRIFDAWPTYRPFVRITDPRPAETALHEYAGQYLSSEVETTFAVRLEGGTLTMAWPRGNEMPLDPVGGDRFVSSRGTVTFTRDAARTIDGLTISNRRLRRFHAERVARTGESPVDGSVTPAGADPRAVVQRQLDAYNRRDIAAFMQTFSSDIEVIDFPDRRRLKGLEAVQATYASLFTQRTQLHATVAARMRVGNYVMDDEYVTGLDDTRVVHVVVIYRVTRGVIDKVWFLKAS